MKPRHKILWVFFACAFLFIIGAFFGFWVLTLVCNALLVPLLILYYRFKVKKWFIPVVVGLLLFYARDFMLWAGISLYSKAAVYCFGGGMLLFYVLALSNFRSNRPYTVEMISLLIMYGFLGFLFLSISELVPEVVPSHKMLTYAYLFFLTLLLAVTFTQYLLKSHYASLWMMLASASLLVSELSLFFQMYVLSDISVEIFYPLFHVIFYYSFVQHGIHRRASARIPYF